jgi:hypothetical protein
MLTGVTVFSAIQPESKEPQPGSLDDPKVKRAIFIGRILGPAIIVVPMGLIVFFRAATRVIAHDPAEERGALAVLAIFVAAGVVITIAAYARRGFDQR